MKNVHPLSSFSLSPVLPIPRSRARLLSLPPSPALPLTRSAYYEHSLYQHNEGTLPGPLVGTSKGEDPYLSRVT